MPDDDDNCPFDANPGQADSDGDGIGNACEVEIFDGSDLSAECRVGVAPAATLLIPRFAVEIDNPSGINTLLSITNARRESTLASVTLWTDWAVPSHTFNLYLAGHDVQVINLRNLFHSGSVPATGHLEMAPPNLAGPHVEFPGCGSPVANSVTASRRSELVAWHGGAPSPISGACASAQRSGSLLHGYVTVDVVNECSPLNPSDPGYFEASGEGVASNENVLLGEYFAIEPGQNYAYGETAVHIRADDSRFGTGDYTFYGRYVDGTGIDHRQPLPDVFMVRYLAGGVFDGSTELTVWRDTKAPEPSPAACEQAPNWWPIADSGLMVCDEHSHGAASGPSDERFHLATQEVVVGSSVLPVLSPFGWLHLDLRHHGSGLFGNSAQAWVVAKHGADDRYNAGFRAFALRSTCGE